MRSIDIIAYCNEDDVPGVANKLLDICHGFKTSGFYAHTVFAKTHKEYLAAIVLSRSTHLFLRLNPCSYSNYFLPILFLLKRARGTSILVEIPTPVSIGVKELLLSARSFPLNLLYTCIAYTTVPWCIFFCNHVLQYAPEQSKPFSLLNHKTIQSANGINTARLAERSAFPSTTSPVFCIIGVATLAKWHGYDKIIIAIDKFYRQHNSHASKYCDIVFKIVGDGPELRHLSEILNTLDLHHSVKLLGRMSFVEYSHLYEESHIALGTLAGYRKGLKYSSSLKDREYCSVGIPYVSSQIDPDVPPDFKYVYCVPNRSSPINLDNIMNWYNELNFTHKSITQMRWLAESRMDFKSKVSTWF